MNTEQVKQIQRQLNARGASLKVDGILGPLTLAAMQSFTKTITPSNVDQNIVNLQKQFGLPQTGVMDETLKTLMNNSVAEALKKNPSAKALLAQNDPASIVNAFTTNDWSGVTDISGKPFSQEQLDEATKKAEEAYAPYFKASEEKDFADTESALGATQEGLNRYLRNTGVQFSEDKKKLDAAAVDQGILFSGARRERENKLKSDYETVVKDTVADVGRSIADTARSYQYQYGNKNAKNLSDYYKVSGATFNPYTSKGKMTTTPLQSMYNPNKFDFQGTIPVNNKANILTRAAGLLSNKAQKLIPY